MVLKITRAPLIVRILKPNIVKMVYCLRGTSSLLNPGTADVQTTIASGWMTGTNIEMAIEAKAVALLNVTVTWTATHLPTTHEPALQPASAPHMPTQVRPTIAVIRLHLHADLAHPLLFVALPHGKTIQSVVQVVALVGAEMSLP